jgi:hypothetical protein
VRQPFPEVISKNKQLTDDALTVKLLTGSTVQVKFASPVKCSILNDVHQTGKGAQPKPIENDEQNLDSTTRTAHFPLKFNQGSRKSPVSLRFGVQVQLTTMNGMAINATIESPATEPFIVITNESQWEDSEQVLLRKDIFGGMVSALRTTGLVAVSNLRNRLKYLGCSSATLYSDTSSRPRDKIRSSLNELCPALISSTSTGSFSVRDQRSL